MECAEQIRIFKGLAVNSLLTRTGNFPLRNRELIRRNRELIRRNMETVFWKAGINECPSKRSKQSTTCPLKVCLSA
jgi:hypothetical protein